MVHAKNLLFRKTASARHSIIATRMGIVRKVLLGLKIHAGCIFSLLLNAFEWRLRFKI
jgi:hypothetical protein